MAVAYRAPPCCVAIVGCGVIRVQEILQQQQRAPTLKPQCTEAPLAAVCKMRSTAWLWVQADRRPAVSITNTTETGGGASMVVHAAKTIVLESQHPVHAIQSRCGSAWLNGGRIGRKAESGISTHRSDYPPPARQHGSAPRCTRMVLMAQRSCATTKRLKVAKGARCESHVLPQQVDGATFPLGEER